MVSAIIIKLREKPALHGREQGQVRGFGMEMKHNNEIGRRSSQVFDEIWQACDELYQAGSAVTQKAVIKHRGKGSEETVAPIVRYYKKLQPVRALAPNVPSGILLALLREMESSFVSMSEAAKSQEEPKTTAAILERDRALNEVIQLKAALSSRDQAYSEIESELQSVTEKHELMSIDMLRIEKELFDARAVIKTRNLALQLKSEEADKLNTQHIQDRDRLSEAKSDIASRDTEILSLKKELASKQTELARLSENFQSEAAKARNDQAQQVEKLSASYENMLTAANKSLIKEIRYSSELKETVAKVTEKLAATLSALNDSKEKELRPTDIAAMVAVRHSYDELLTLIHSSSHSKKGFIKQIQRLADVVKEHMGAVKI